MPRSLSPPLSPSWALASPLRPCPHPSLPCQEYHLGIGITFIDMSVGNVKDADRRSFDLTTPYRIFRCACPPLGDRKSVV